MWTYVTEKTPRVSEIIEITYRRKSVSGTFFYWDVGEAFYIGHNIYMLADTKKKLRKSVVAWRPISDRTPCYIKNWDESKDEEYWNEVQL